MPVVVLSEEQVKAVEARLPAVVSSKFRDRLLDGGREGVMVLLEEYPNGGCQVAPVALVESRISTRDGSGGWQRFLDLWVLQSRIT